MKKVIIGLLCLVCIIIALGLFIVFSPKRRINRERVRAHRIVRKALKSKMEKYHRDSYECVSDFLKHINKVQRRLGAINHVAVFGRDGKSFPIDSYMEIYSSIGLKTWKKDYFCYYHVDGIGGRPFIMAINRCYALFIKKLVTLNNVLLRGHDLRLFMEPIEMMKKNAASLYMQAEDSVIGYVQLLHFREFGDNFSLFWHANYHSKYVVTSIEQIRQQVKVWRNGPYRHDLLYEKHNPLTDKELLSSKVIRDKDLELLYSLSEHDIVPKIEMDSDYCTIEWLENRIHFGLSRCRYRISRKDCSIELLSKEVIVAVIPTFRF